MSRMMLAREAENIIKCRMPAVQKSSFALPGSAAEPAPPGLYAQACFAGKEPSGRRAA